MTRNIDARLRRLEQHVAAGRVDLDSERARYGRLTSTDREGRRYYQRQAGADAHLTVVGHAQTQYQIVGIDLADLV